MTLWVKLPLVASLSHIRGLAQVPYILVIQLPANVLCRAAEDGPRTWVLAFHIIWEMRIEFLARGFTLSQIWLLRPLEK